MTTLLFLAATDYSWMRDLDLWAGVAFFLFVLLLVWVGARPLLDALRQRQASIEKSLQEAATAQQETEALIARQAKQRQEAEAQAQAIREQAKTDAEVVRKDLAAKAQEEADRIRHRAQRDIELAKHKAVEKLAERTVQLSSDIAERAMRAQLEATDHERLIQQSIADLEKPEEVNA